MNRGSSIPEECVWLGVGGSGPAGEVWLTVVLGSRAKLKDTEGGRWALNRTRQEKRVSDKFVWVWFFVVYFLSSQLIELVLHTNTK